MRSMVEGGSGNGRPMWQAPLRQAFTLPPPRTGEE